MPPDLRRVLSSANVCVQALTGGTDDYFSARMCDAFSFFISREKDKQNAIPCKDNLEALSWDLPVTGSFFRCFKHLSHGALTQTRLHIHAGFIPASLIWHPE
jgi:hypothetical protein